MDKWTDKRNFSPSYWTLSPVEAAAQKHVNCPILLVSESLPYLSHLTQGIINQTYGAIGIFIKGFKKQQKVSPIQIYFPQSNSLPLNSISSNPRELILHLWGSRGPYHTRATGDNGTTSESKENQNEPKILFFNGAVYG